MWMVLGAILLAALVFGGVCIAVLLTRIKKEDRKRVEEEKRWALELERKRKEFLEHDKREQEEWLRCEKLLESTHPQYVDPPLPPLTSEEFSERISLMETKRKKVADMMVEWQGQNPSPKVRP